MPVYHSSQVLDWISKDFTYTWFAFQACSYHATKNFIESIIVVCQGGGWYEHVILVTHHKIPVLLRYPGQSLGPQSLKGRRGVAQAKGHPLLLVQPQFTCESGFYFVLFSQRDLPEGRTQVQYGEDVGFAKFREALVYSRYRVRIFSCHCVQVTKVATKPKLPHFFLAMTNPQAQGDFEGFIMSYSSNISISARHASDLLDVIRLAPSIWGMAPSSNSISYSTKLQQTISAFCFENTSAFRIKIALNDSKSPLPTLPLKCSISGKTYLLWRSSLCMCRYRSRQFSLKLYIYQLDSGSLSRYISSSFVSPHSRSSSAKRNQVSSHAESKPWCPVCSITHWHTARFVLLKSSGLKSPSFDYLGWVPDRPFY